MKSLHKSSSPSLKFSAWRVADLDVEANALSVEIESEQIKALFSTGGKDASNRPAAGSRSNLHPNGTALSLTNWLPNEIDQHSGHRETNEDEWDFFQPSNDFFSIPEQQIWKEKFDAEKERVELIRQARAEAQNILLQAQEEASQLIQQAQEEIARSITDGYQKGSQDARSELQSALNATCQLVEETQTWQAEIMNQGETFLVDMLKDIAQSMFGEGVHLDPNAIQLNLNRVMEHAQRLGDLNILLNPRDAQVLDPSWSEYQHMITGNRVRIVPSEKIKPGGCVVKGNTGTVDGRVEMQLTAVLNMLTETSETSG